MSPGVLRRTAGWLARRPLPTAASAVLGYYARSGAFDLDSLRLKRRVDERMDAFVDGAFAEVEAVLAEEFDVDDPTFEYDTKLLMPAELTLGYLYRRLDDPDRIERAESLTQLIVVALIEGDVRDARNDEEYADFEVDFQVTEDERPRVARITGRVLSGLVEASFEAFSDDVREAYGRAVKTSETHQDRDPYFRELMARLRTDESGPDAGAGPGTAADGAGEADDATAAGEAAESDDAATEAAVDDPAAAVRREYRDAAFDDVPESLAGLDGDLPYLETQYDRVGVIYDGMLDMYEAAGFEIEPAYRRSIVLAIVGAQIWLDDVDDYAGDVADGQLTPVTAEYLLADDEADAYRSVVDLSDRYLRLSTEAASTADSPLAGIAAEYIRHDGDPSVLPGHPDGPAN